MNQRACVPTGRKPELNIHPGSACPHTAATGEPVSTLSLKLQGTRSAALPIALAACQSAAAFALAWMRFIERSRAPVTA
jgi:hypothetical protein